MSNWQRKLNIKDLHEAFREGTIKVSALAGKVADRLEKLRSFGIEEIDEERVRVIERFREVADDDQADVEEYDDALSDLYDWADTKLDTNWPPKAVCWVNHF